MEENNNQKECSQYYVICVYRFTNEDHVYKEDSWSYKRIVFPEEFGKLKDIGNIVTNVIKTMIKEGEKS